MYVMASMVGGIQLKLMDLLLCATCDNDLRLLSRSWNTVNYYGFGAAPDLE